MANPAIHALIFAAAVLIPGGLIVYFAWHALQKRRAAKIIPQKPSFEDARQAFLDMYPPESLRKKSRLQRLADYKARRRKKPPK